MGIASVQSVCVTSVFSDDTAARARRAVLPAVTETAPEPSATEAVVPVPAKVQAPPASAVPKPVVTVRVKVSWASGWFGAVAVTVLVTVFVAPPLSVTVRVTA